MIVHMYNTVISLLRIDVNRFEKNIIRNSYEFINAIDKIILYSI
jgi:hypothetical protein